MVRCYCHIPSGQIPAWEVSSLGTRISFLIRVRRMRKRLRLKVHVVSGDTQCLFRKSSGFSVCFFFMCHFRSHKPTSSGLPGQVRLKPDPNLLGASEAGAEARDWQACFVTARWQAGKGGFSGASVLTMDGSRGAVSGGKARPLAVRQVEMRGYDKTGQLCTGSRECVSFAAPLLRWLPVTFCAG